MRKGEFLYVSILLLLLLLLLNAMFETTSFFRLGISPFYTLFVAISFPDFSIDVDFQIKIVLHFLYICTE